LFQNRYKSIVCEEDPYRLELLRYIHLNPIRAGLVKGLKELDRYPWCGHSAILGNRKNPLIPKRPPNDAPSADRRIAISLLHQGTEKEKTNPEDPVDHVKNNKNSLAEKTIEDVLLHFGVTIKVAHRRYRQFVNNGIDQACPPLLSRRRGGRGTRPELQGGGLVRPACHARPMGILKYENVERKYSTSKRQLGVKARAGRSAGGEKTGLIGRKKEERELSDERILGSGDFVAKALEEANELGERRAKSMISLDEIIKRVTTEIGADYKELISFKRDKRLSNARAIISYLAAIELGYTGVKIADTLRLSGKSVSRCIERGKKIVDNDRRILDYLQ